MSVISIPILLMDIGVQLRKTIMLAKSLGVPIVNLHLSRGVYFTLPDQKSISFLRV